MTKKPDNQTIEHLLKPLQKELHDVIKSSSSTGALRLGVYVSNEFWCKCVYAIYWGICVDNIPAEYDVATHDFIGSHQLFGFPVYVVHEDPVHTKAEKHPPYRVVNMRV